MYLVGVVVTRFAPSPTGLLHLGHAYSALLNLRFASDRGGRALLRIEDIDPVRCRPEFDRAIVADLEWLGLAFEAEVLRQSERLALYEDALGRLAEQGVVYRDHRTRSEYAPGVRPEPAAVEAAVASGRPAAWRLDLQAAFDRLGSLSFLDFSLDDGAERTVGVSPSDLAHHGDVIVARKDVPTSYHLAVVVDDAAQGVSHVIRGSDLEDSTGIHRLLQELLGLPAPRYHHHRLITDGKTGRRFAKRDGSVTLRQLREDGMTADEVRAAVGFA